MGDAIVVESKITLQDYRKFRSFQQYHRRRWSIPLRVALCVWILLLWPFFIIVYDGYYAYPLWATAALLTYFVFVYFIRRANEKSFFRAAKHLSDSKIRYEFQDEVMSVSRESPDVTGHSEVHYNAFDKVYETKDAFYLYLSVRQAYLVPKTQAGQAMEQLSALLRNRLGDKFIKRG